VGRPKWRRTGDGDEGGSDDDDDGDSDEDFFDVIEHGWAQAHRSRIGSAPSRDFIHH